MIQATFKSAPHRVTPHIGHLLLLMWIEESNEKQLLFTTLFENIRETFEFELLSMMINTAAQRCFDEYQELYAYMDTTDNEDMYQWYRMVKESFPN